MANTEKQICTQCGAPLDTSLNVCKYCGAEIAVKPRNSAPQQLYTQQSNQYSTNQYTQQTHTYMQQTHTHVQQSPPQYIPPQAPVYAQTMSYNTQNSMSGYYPYKQKSKVLAGVLAIFFGTFGIHKFYTGHVGWGFVYLLFFWTYIPAMVGFVEGIIYLCTSNENFNMKYVKHKN